MNLRLEVLKHDLIVCTYLVSTSGRGQNREDIGEYQRLVGDRTEWI